jgi:hypothetical protein
MTIVAFSAAHVAGALWSEGVVPVNVLLAVLYFTTVLALPSTKTLTPSNLAELAHVTVSPKGVPAVYSVVSDAIAH